MLKQQIYDEIVQLRSEVASLRAAVSEVWQLASTRTAFPSTSAASAPDVAHELQATAATLLGENDAPPSRSATEHALDGKDEAHVPDLVRELTLPPGVGSEVRVAAALRALGWSRVRPMREGRRRALWCRMRPVEVTVPTGVRKVLDCLWSEGVPGHGAGGGQEGVHVRHYPHVRGLVSIVGGDLSRAVGVLNAHGSRFHAVVDPLGRGWVQGACVCPERRDAFEVAVAQLKVR